MGGNKKLFNFEDLTTSQIVAIQSDINKGAGIRVIKRMLKSEYDIVISFNELNNNLVTLHNDRVWKSPTKIVRMAKSYIGAWADCSTLEWTYKNARPKKSRTLYINNFKTVIKLASFINKNNDRIMEFHLAKSTGEKKEYFTSLMKEAMIKGYLKGTKRVSIDSQATIDNKFCEANNITMVRQEKSIVTPYQSEVEGTFGTLKSPFFLWLGQFTYETDGDKRSYNITEEALIEELTYLRNVHIYKTKYAIPQQVEAKRVILSTPLIN